MPEYVVTETLDDPSLNPLWVGEARDALHALDQFCDQEEFCRYSDLEDLPDWVGETVLWPERVELPEGALWATFTNTTIFALPTGN